MRNISADTIDPPTTFASDLATDIIASPYGYRKSIFVEGDYRMTVNWQDTIEHEGKELNFIIDGAYVYTYWLPRPMPSHGDLVQMLQTMIDEVDHLRRQTIRKEGVRYGVFDMEDFGREIQ